MRKFASFKEKLNIATDFYTDAYNVSISITDISSTKEMGRVLRKHSGGGGEAISCEGRKVFLAKDIK